MVKDYLKEINGRLTDDINMFTGGINSYMDKAFIEPEQMPYCMNMAMYKPPMMCTRASRETIKNILPEQGHVIVAMWAYNESLVFWITRNVEAEGTATLYVYDVAQKATRIIDNSIVWSNSYWFCYARREVDEYLYICTYHYKYKLTITESPTSGDFQSVDDGYTGIPAFHKGRLFFANPMSNRVYYSALNDFDNFMEFPDMSDPIYLNSDITLVDGSASGAPAHTGAFNTGENEMTLNGNVIATKNTTFYYDVDNKEFIFETGNKLTYKENETTHTYQWMQELYDYSSYAGYFFVTNSKGSLTSIVSFDDKLVIFAEHSIHLLYGDTPLTTSSYQFQLVDMNNNLGCIATKSIAVGGGHLYWLGDDNEIYSYSGSTVDMISRPNSSRYVQRNGGISNIPIKRRAWASTSYYTEICATATSDKYYIVLPISRPARNLKEAKVAYPMFVFDVYNKIWWAEDGAFSAICNLSFGTNKILMARNGDIFKTTKYYWSTDYILDENGVYSQVPIDFEFHTRVYGADGVSSRKSLTKVWVQASADADIYLTDSWTTTDYWTGTDLDETIVKLGTIERKGRPVDWELETYNERYDDDLYEQQMLVVPKMYGERLNTFQIVVKGTGASKFYLMKREWSAR